MAGNVGELKARLSLDAGGFAAGVGKAKAEISGLKKTSDDATRGMRAAAGANANLVSQFNDIGVMMAAGQNPLQLALQQGTQISQVLTQMGGGVGALRALGGAFVGMLNPVSLATIGVIGFGAAAVQWLMPAQEEAKKAEDAFKSLKESMSGYNDAFGVSLLYTGQAEKLYGEEAQRGAAIARKIMVMEAERTRSTISGIMSKAYSDLGFDAFGERGIDGAGRIESANLAQAAGKLGFKSESWGETLWGFGGLDRDKLAMAERFGNTMRDIFAYLGKPVPEGGLDDYLTGLRQKLDAFDAQLKAAKEAGADGTALAAIDAEMIPLQRALLEGEKQRADIRAADAAKAEEMLATFEREAELRALTLEYGERSREVTEYQAQAEREKQYLLIDSMNITDEMKQSLWDAADASYDATMQTRDWQDAMAAVRKEIQDSAALINALGGSMIMNAKINAAKSVRDAGGSAVEARRAGEIAGRKQEILNGQNTPGSPFFSMSDATVQNYINQVDLDFSQNDEWSGLTTEARKPRGGKKGGSARKSRGARSGADRFSDRVGDLQADTQAVLAQVEAFKSAVAAGGDWERQLAIIEEEQKLLTEAQKSNVALSPEMLANIRQMAGAHVDAERTLKSLREEQEEFARTQDEIKGAFGSAFSDWISGASSFKDALGGIIAKLAEMAASKAFEGLWGLGGGDGGGLGSLLGSLLSFDGGGHTGDGARSGGLDGKGGFLAMMHPNETILDHTKGQGLGGNGGTLVVRATHDLGIMLEVIDSRINAAAPSIQRGAVGQMAKANSKTKSVLR
ncbi:phage tail length tape measure family protein [Paracoccus cavernae]